MESLVSIIVPIYKAEDYLQACVDSILCQSYKGIEVILVDDGSPDSCPQICEEFTKQDKRIRVIHKKNGGASDARNVGILSAKGDYVMFIDGDDIIHPLMVENLQKYLDDNEVDVVSCLFRRFAFNGKPDTSFTSGKHEVIDSLTALNKLLYEEIDCSPCTKMYRKESLKGLAFVVGRTNEDVLFLFQLYQQSKHIVLVDEVYYYYRTTPNSVTQTISEKKLDILKNMHDIEDIVVSQKLPIERAIEYYRLRQHLEIAYRIAKNRKIPQFRSNYNISRFYVLNHLLYMLISDHFSLRDLVHVLFIAIKY